LKTIAAKMHPFNSARNIEIQKYLEKNVKELSENTILLPFTKISSI
jgi:hypothetical protein